MQNFAQLHFTDFQLQRAASDVEESVGRISERDLQVAFAFARRAK